MAKKVVETPLMKQYAEMKQKHPDAILLFRVGDFYETFSDDAIAASEILGITLTRRANGAASYVELAGFPHHALDTYLPRLVRAGKRVAICEQLEDPKLTKKLVKRGITELVTPGVVLNDNVLDHRENNFLAALHHGAKDRWGVSFLDISTGEFLTAEGTADYVDKLLGSYAPKEVLVLRGSRGVVEQTFTGKYLCFELDDWVYTYDAALERLLAQFQTASLKGFGIDRMPSAIIACGAALRYLDITNHKQTGHITTVSPIEEDNYVRLDTFTRRNLELTHPLAEDGMSLYDVLNRTVTPMGARMMHSWIQMPLRDVDAINRRLDVIEFFFKNPELREDLEEILYQIGDLGRLVGKVASLRALPRDLVAIKAAMTAMSSVKARCMASDCPELVRLGKKMDDCKAMTRRIADTLLDDTPNKVGSGKTVRPGVNAELDELRDIAGSGKQYLERIKQREIDATGIPSLKISYNNVFGYYIEVTNTHRDKVPDEWIRKQTLVNAERYITPELKEYEEKILGAESRIQMLEQNLFDDLLASMQQYVTAMQTDAHLIAIVDCLLSLCRVAVENRYVRPVVDNSLVVDLKDARHPVIERRLPPGEPYIANSVHLDNEGTQILMITGPNMSGKSALLRQTALNVLMAQMGSFVAAESAHIGIVDKIFTRVGASDNISLGESTFMVEMNEAATIINSMTQRSLILFDELGRGTSTYDGISIAWAIVEHIHERANLHPKTLFATHYHELNEMADAYPRIANYHVAVSEIDGRVVFLRKLEPGGSEHSFGIHVARLAGMPCSIVERADKVLAHLESERRAGDSKTLTPPPPQQDGGTQLSFFQLDDPILCQLRDALLNLDINSLTPLAALNKLQEMQTILSGK